MTESRPSSRPAFKLPEPPGLPGLERRAGELRQQLRSTAPEVIANRARAVFVPSAAGAGEFRFHLFQIPVTGAYPDFIFTSGAAPLPEFQQALLLYYLATADGEPLGGEWVSFAALPGGRLYDQAFQGYSGTRLRNTAVQAGGEDQFLDLMERASLALGGQRVDIGAAAFAFLALPALPVLISCWPGDEDFPSSCKVLFDASATHYLPIDGCAILGSHLVSRLVRWISNNPPVPPLP